MGTIFFITFLNLMGFGIVIPILPFYAAEFGAGPAAAGLLIGSYAAAQFVGAPLFGRLSDQRGRRPVLLYTTVFIVLGNILFGLAGSLALLFASRILTGFMNGNISAAQAFIRDITEEKERAKGYGILGAAFGLGLVAGPALGGFLSAWGYPMAAYGAALLSFLSLIAIYFFLPETLVKNTSSLSEAEPVFSLTALREALKRPYAGAILKTRFVFSISFSVFATVFALYTEYGLGFSAPKTAFLLAYVGILMVIIQGFLVDKMALALGEGKLLFYSIFLLTASLAGWAFSHSFGSLLLALVPLAFAGGIFNTLINSSLSKVATNDEAGGLLGISAALESFTRIAAPSFGGYLMSQLGLWAPGIFGALVLAAFIPYSYRHFIKNPHPALRKTRR